MSEQTFDINNSLRWIELHDFEYTNWQKTSFNKTEWENFNWDYSKLEKPSFEDMVEYDNLYQLRNTAGYLSYYSHRHTDFRNKITEQKFIENVHTGKGLGHMAGLLQMVENATTAGQIIPKIKMQNPNGGTHDFHTQHDIREVLEKAARNENIIESCHNIVMGKYRAEVYKWKNSDLTFSEREIAAKKSKQILIDYETLLKSEIDNFNPNALPNDLQTLKIVLLERLESAAMKHIQYLRGVVSQQGIDLPATCEDAAEAETDIAVLRYKGAILIENANSNDNAINVFNLYAGNIEKVKVKNSPYFTLRNSDDKLNHVIARTGLTLELSLKQNNNLTPDTLQIISIHDREKVGINLTTMEHQIDIDIVVKPGWTGSIDLNGRNLCGPTKLGVALTGENNGNQDD